jgi:hypothetical protein
LDEKLEEKLGGKRIDIIRLMKTNPKITVSKAEGEGRNAQGNHILLGFAQ